MSTGRPAAVTPLRTIVVVGDPVEGWPRSGRTPAEVRPHWAMPDAALRPWQPTPSGKMPVVGGRPSRSAGAGDGRRGPCRRRRLPLLGPSVARDLLTCSQPASASTIRSMPRRDLSCPKRVARHRRRPPRQTSVRAKRRTDMRRGHHADALTPAALGRATSLPIVQIVDAKQRQQSGGRTWVIWGDRPGDAGGRFWF